MRRATRTVQVTVNDGSANSNTATAPSTSTGVNDAPVNILPASISVTEVTPTKLATIQVSDADAGSGNITVTVSIPGNSGTLSAVSGGGVTIGGSATALTLTGSVANINAFLSNVAQSVTYTPLANSNTDVTLTVTTNDNGNTGSGGSKTDTDTLTLDLQAVNDAPSGTNNAITVLEDNGHTFAAANFGFTDSDGNSLLGVKISTLPATGSLTLDGVAVSPGQVIPAGSLGLLVWTPSANSNGNGLASLTFQVIDMVARLMAVSIPTHRRIRLPSMSRR